MNDLTTAALAYARAGLHLLALTGKQPSGKWHPEWDYERSIHGEGEPTWEERAAFEAIFEDDLVTGVAILIPEHFYVADVDKEPAAIILRDLLGGEFAIDTAASQTRNGLHIWFYAPGAHASRWVGGRDGLLLKGLGGYVVAPPSKHPAGGVYRWLNPLVVDGRICVADMPASMAATLQAIDRVDHTARVGDGEGQSHPEEDPGFWGWSVEGTGSLAGGTLHVRAGWNLDGLENAIIEAPDGNQNNVIAWAALTARDGGVPYDVAMTKLLDASLRGNHPKARAVTTIKGVYERGKR